MMSTTKLEKRDPEPGHPADGLRVEHVTIRYGGHVAVDDFSFAAPMGRATGLIGPNGAGKTSTFNAVSGLVRPSGGAVALAGRDITRLRSSTRAQRGLGRTFQRIQLCDQLTVRENVELGPEALAGGRGVLSQVFGSAKERTAVRAATEDALDACGLQGRAGRVAGSLSTGERRLVELARAIASDFDVFLLDEPSSGLDTAETERFGTILRSALLDRGKGVLLVEHDISLVRAVCEYVYVLDFGQLLTEGPTASTLDSDVVRRAYLGMEVEHA